jgi:hypothetical protein
MKKKITFFGAFRKVFSLTVWIYLCRQRQIDNCYIDVNTIFISTWRITKQFFRSSIWKHCWNLWIYYIYSLKYKFVRELKVMLIFWRQSIISKKVRIGVILLPNDEQKYRQIKNRSWEFLSILHCQNDINSKNYSMIHIGQHLHACKNSWLRHTFVTDNHFSIWLYSWKPIKTST